MQPNTSIALFISLSLAAACGDNLEAPELGVDAGGADVCTSPTPDRIAGCARECTAGVALCDLADVVAPPITECQLECLAGVAQRAWCPSSPPACPPWWPGCPVGELRAVECRATCAAWACAGSTIAECEADCRAFDFDHYCPGAL